MHRDKKVVVVGGPLDWWEGSSPMKTRRPLCGGRMEISSCGTSWTWQCEMCPTLSAIYFTCSVS